MKAMTHSCPPDQYIAMHCIGDTNTKISMLLKDLTYQSYRVCLSFASLFFLPDPGVSGVRSMGLGVSIYLSPRALVDFVDVTLTDDDTNSILLMMLI